MTRLYNQKGNSGKPSIEIPEDFETKSNLANLANSAAYERFSSAVILIGMKQTNPTAQMRSVRSWFSRVFNRITQCNCQADISAMREHFHQLEDLVDVVAREVARQAKLLAGAKKSK